MIMQTLSLLRIATLALVLAAPLATIANAGDHAGNQWRDDNDNSRVSTSYVQPNPALVQMELNVYRADLARQALSQTASSGQPGAAVAN
jgi:hypothetical protein